jgi:hypothetical protein
MRELIREDKNAKPQAGSRACRRNCFPLESIEMTEEFLSFG